MGKPSIHSIRESNIWRYLPELEKLKEIQKRNLEHDECDYDHSMAAHKSIIKLLNFNFVKAKKKKELLKRHFGTKISRYTRRDLLIFTSMIHDVGDYLCERRNPDGTNLFPGHEETGALLAEDICRRFDLSKSEIIYVVNNVRFHLLPHKLYDTSYKNKAKGTKMLHNFRSKAKELAPDLFVHCIADLYGCTKFPKSDPKRFIFANKFLTDALIDSI